MLLIHPDSTCDVCLDPYSWATSDNTPHAISCGHVFCNTCLNHLRPPHCPLCRKAFTADRVKKLHVDRYDPSPTNDTENEARELMDRIALNSGENTARETVEEILNEAKRWLDRDGHSSTYPAVHAAFSVLVRYRSLLEVRSDHERELSELRARLHRRRAMEEEDQMNSTLIEQNLVREVRVTTVLCCHPVLIRSSVAYGA
ncbi:hypothetical protein BV25DRAFT_1281463 [Artomyces pyxidatus]|uniref:Uncharacterized protein n=1 Tax=Artomyces pyxidatus TaxID=48021 RepID=A0ACB8TFA8_9AGAM|nr:hypothetical protein BV25DRAFT_1281463 [Artomyces pyxidatus]